MLSLLNRKVVLWISEEGISVKREKGKRKQHGLNMLCATYHSGITRGNLWRSGMINIS